MACWSSFIRFIHYTRFLPLGSGVYSPESNYGMPQVEDNSLGSPPAEQILHELQPSHWFSAHLHVKYAALVPHTTQHQNQQGRGQNQQGQGQKRKSPTRGSSPPPPGLGNQGKVEGKFTRFLALDKCLPRRGFLQVCRHQEWSTNM